MNPVSLHTLLLAIHSMAKERKAVATKLDSGDFNEDELEPLNDDIDQLTKALGELGSLYEPLREGQKGAYPPLEKILALYD